MKTLTWQNPGQHFVAQELIKIIINHVAELREFNKEVIEKHFKEVVDFARLHQLPLYCGEFGCIAATPKADKERWYQDMIELFDKYEIARANWDYKGGFGIIEQGIPQTDLIYILTGRNIK